MKRSEKEIKKRIKELENAYSMGGHRKDEKIEILEECLELDEFEIEERADEYIDSDYDLYAVYDWVINGRDCFL